MSAALQSFTELIRTVGLERVFLLLMAPIFIASMVLEARVLAARGRQTYTAWETACNVTLALSHALSDGIAWLLVIGLFERLYAHRLFEMPEGWAAVPLLLLAQDFLYYWFHRASHRVRWMWASHVTHHSSERMNLSTALRQSITYPISGMWVFWLPLAWMGFRPEHVVLAVAMSLGFQFFVHTEAVRRLPRWVEAVFNTPSHHRVHHARNPQYIDRNYAGVFIVWDKLFGSFVPEEAPCDYGIVEPVRTRNPLVMMFHEWGSMLADVMRPGPWPQRLAHLWRPPEWKRPWPDQAGS